MLRSSHEIRSTAPSASFRRIKAFILFFSIGLLLLLANLPFVPSASAQSNTLRFERISTEQGLAQSTVNAILQDHQGFMWFATEGGLNRYDGYQFTIFQHDPDNPQSLANNSVNSLYEDRSGTLWLGTANGLDRFDPGTRTFAHYAHMATAPTSLSGSFVQAICEDRAGILWIGTDDGGLDQFDKSTGTFRHYRHVANDPGSLSDDAVRTIYNDHDGVLWIGTNVGLDRFDATTQTFTHYRQSPDSSHLVNDYTVLGIEEHDGALWFGTRSGVVQLDRRSGQFVEYRNNPNDPSSLGSDAVASLYEDSDGTLWMGGRSGLERLVDGQNRFLHYRYDVNDPDSLSSDYVRSIYQDRSGVLWIGTSDGGLSTSSPARQKFELYQSHPGQTNNLSDNNVWAVHQDRDGILWIGTFFAGLNALDRETGKVTLYRHDPNNPQSLLSDEVRVIVEDSSGNLWIGTEHGGLDRFERNTGVFVHYQHDPGNPQSLSDNDVFAIYQDHEYRLWIGTQNGGLNRLNLSDGTFTHYLHDPNNPASLSHNHVDSIFQDNQGNLWIASLGGLDRWDSVHNQFVHYRHDSQNPASLSNDMVTSIVQDANGICWVGTYGGGLDRFDCNGQAFTHYTVKNGLPDDTVYSILIDAHGCLWLSTNKGLSKFDPRTETFRNYSASDGLQGLQFNPRAFSQSQTGEMFFGGTQGLNAFYPDQVRETAFAPPVVITAFTKLNQPFAIDLSGTKPIQLSYQDNVISFEFAALDYNAPAMNQYAYKLDGVDSDWVLAGTRRYASYTNLSGGDYVFRVKATNSDGVWGPEELALKVQVAPPFWETWWFRGVLVLALVVTAWSAYRIRIRSMQTRRRELETQVAQRTHDLATLNAISRVVSHSLDLKEILRDAVERTLQVVEMEVGSALILDEGTQDLVSMAYHGLSDTPVQLGARWPIASALAGKTVDGVHPLAWNVATDYPDGALKARLVRDGIQLVVGVPLIAKEKMVGMLVLSTRTPRALTPEESSLLSAIGQQIGIAVENARLYEQAEQAAAITERSRLARELHDSVTQLLYSVTLYAEAAAQLLEAGKTTMASKHLGDLRDTAQEALREMRLLIFELRPLELEKMTLVAAIRARLDAVESRGGMRVDMHIEGEERLPRAMQAELYHIVQEALNNTLKHSNAKQVSVALRFAENETCLQIQDDGAGFDLANAQQSGGLGLLGMQERAQKIGGTLCIASEPGKGTTITIRVPVVVQENGGTR